MHIAIIWQRFLPYHIARIQYLHRYLADLGHRLTGIEIASQDVSYGFPETHVTSTFESICCFPGITYHSLRVREIHRRVTALLAKLGPDIVFAPATPFPEGMAAIRYRIDSGKRLVLMDDAWEHTDRRGAIIKGVKKLIHQECDAVLAPAPSHAGHFVRLGFPEDRIIFGVDAVDNAFFAEHAAAVRAQSEQVRKAFDLPGKYFLCVGRFLPRKGLEMLVSSYRAYAEKAGKDAWGLVLVGGDKDEARALKISLGHPGIHFAGRRFGADLCVFYALAGALVVPSDSDPWGLVVNEGMASGLPVLVSRGCGCAATLIRADQNGWTFAPGDCNTLTALMERLSSLPEEQRQAMGECSCEIIAEWGLDRFNQGVLAAMALPRREPAGVLSRLAVRLWEGHVRVY